MRIIRIAAIAVGALIGLLVVVAIAVLVFVDPNRFRGDIERAAQEHTGRVLTIHGKLQLSVFPWLGLAVNDVELGNRPGFGTQPFMAVQKASIRVKVLPLLARHIEVSRIGLAGVHINLVSRGQENNWQDLGQSKGSPPPAPQGTSGSLQGSLSIEGVDLGKSSLIYQDELKKSATEIADLELHTGPLETGPARTTVGKVELQGTYLAHSQGQDEGLKPLAFSLGTPGLTLDRAADTLAPAKIDLQLGDTRLQISMSGEHLSAERLVTGTAAVPVTSPRKLLQSLGIAAPVTRDSRALSTFALQTNFRLTRAALQLTALQLTLDDTHVQGTAAIDNLETDAMSFDLAVNAINLDRYRAPVEPVDKNAAKSAPKPPKAPTPLPLDTLRKVDAHGTFRVGSATLSNVVLTEVVVPLAAKDGHIRVGPTQARVYGGTCDGDIVLDARAVQAELSVNQHVHGTDIGALMKAAADSTRLSGHADANVAVTGIGNTDDAITRSLSGKIDANVKQGALNGVDVGYELQRVNALLKKQAPPQRSGPARTVFNTLQTSGTLDKGMLRIDQLRIETDFLKVRGGGTLDTVTEAINYQLVASGSGLDALKSVEVPLTITGTLSSPVVRPDIEALAKGKLRQEVQQKANELVKKKLGDKLKGLFGH